MTYEIIETEFMGVKQTSVIIDLGEGNFKSIPCVDDNPEWLAFKEQENL